MVRKNLKHSRMKVWYDCKAKHRSFKPGDQVLMLLPISGHPLQARYHGPYVVERKVNNVDYSRGYRKVYIPFPFSVEKLRVLFLYHWNLKVMQTIA